MARILIHTFGSYGDLHPYIAVALGAAVARTLQREDGVAAACDRLEAML